jgi:Raf kinase inhibitor-like YbhB/YbcL family protein
MRIPTPLRLALAALPLLVAACGEKRAPDSVYQSGAIRVSSPAFSPGGKIPQKHAMAPDGKNVSPALDWSGVPAGTKRFAVIVDDPDAPGASTFVHWVAWNILGSEKGLPEGVPADKVEFYQGTNGFNQIDWGGPQPPPGETHKYVFNVYALDADLPLARGATAAQLVEAMKGHVLATGKVIATYP